ncbi:MAG: hypothetical protein KatS3mg129_2099 [Leptospiraceae bacterium]|nr:MAG: hypothetical protein KatS3mg129_2099 [Leptospiraceae bacterium]
MLLNKFNQYVVGKKNLTFWLIFLYCSTPIPVRIEIQHQLEKIDSNVIWQSKNQSLKSISEFITLYLFYDDSYKKLSYFEDFKNIYFKEKDCKKKNDLLLNYFLSFKLKKKSAKEEVSKEEILNLQNYAFDLIQSCKKNEYIESNAKNIIYWLSTYEEYNFNN